MLNIIAGRDWRHHPITSESEETSKAISTPMRLNPLIDKRLASAMDVAPICIKAEIFLNRDSLGACTAVQRSSRPIANAGQSAELNAMF